MEGFRFVSCLRFSFQLLVAECAFVRLFPRKNRFWLRLPLALTVYLASLRGIYLVVRSIPGQWLPVYTIYYVLCFSLTLLGIGFCFDARNREVLFAGIGGYAVQHMAFGTTRLFLYFFPQHEETPIGYFVTYFCFYIALPLVMYTFFLRELFDRDGLQKRNLRILWLALLVLAINITLSQMTRSALAGEGNAFLQQCVCSIYMILCSCMELLLLFYIPHESRLQQESEMMDKMIHTMESKLQLSRKNIDIINRRCHEIKCQLAELAKENKRLAQSDSVCEIEQAIAAYDGIYQTGNTALDYVLNEHSALMQEECVQFTCMADGKQLSFMQRSDISTLFGNALDNALEHVLKEDNRNIRFIDLRVERKGDMVHIHLSNTCTRRVAFQDDMPVFAGDEGNLHGFGVKSIVHIIEKYDGIWSFRWQNRRFVLDAACPTAQKKHL